uniref:Pre-rRNA-processing protein PNO1 n=1 Tax=Blastobotrys adeninivorans TaxID=409370 RepID=A0A060SZA1_BLAAD
MVAPTAKLKEDQSIEKPVQVEDAENDEVLIDVNAAAQAEDQDEEMGGTKEAQNQGEGEGLVMDAEGKPKFASVKNTGRKVRSEKRAIQVPPHRFNMFKSNWMKIYQPLVDHLKLQVMMNAHKRKVLIRTCPQTTDPGAIQKGDDFLRAICLGFDVDDAIALLRLDDLYIETFEVKDVKTLEGDHLSRAIGRIAGKDGKTKFAIENASRTRVVLADSKIHILGGFSNIKIARETIVSLILGAPPGKVYGNLRTISSRMKERY